MKNRNWFWGFFFLLAAVFLIASQIGSFVHIGFFSILITILLAALFIDSLIKLNYFGIFVPLGFLYMIFQQPLSLPYLTPWLLILSSVLISIAFSIFFRKKPNKSFEIHGKIHHEHDQDHFNHSGENIDDNNPYVKVSFGSSSKYLHADHFKSGQFTVSFGELEVYFDQVQLDPEGADVFVDCSFGALKLFIPRQWNVSENIHTSLGGIDYKGRKEQTADNAPRLNLTGNVQLGGIELHYV